jgi:hypothetical protein
MLGQTTGEWRIMARAITIEELKAARDRYVEEIT